MRSIGSSQCFLKVKSVFIASNYPQNITERTAKFEGGLVKFYSTIAVK